MSNFKGIFHAVWLPVLLLSVFTAAFITLLISDSQLDVFRLRQHGAYLVVMVVLGGICAFLAIWTMARLMSFLNELPRLWNLKRMTVVFIVTLLVITPLALFLAGGAWLMFFRGNTESHFLMKILLLLIVTLLFSLLILPMVYVDMKYLKEKDLHYLKSFTTNYKKGIRYVGFIFVASILKLLIALVITTVVLMPLYVLLIAKTISLNGEAVGDPADLPGHFIWLVFGAMVVACFVVSTILIYGTLVAYFTYGAIEQKQTERFEAKEMVKTVKE